MLKVAGGADHGYLRHWAPSLGVVDLLTVNKTIYLHVMNHGGLGVKSPMERL